MYALEELRAAIARDLSAASGAPEAEALAGLEQPPDSKLGDLSSTLAFSLAKQKKTNPAKLAQEIQAKLKKNPKVAKVELKGPYINFFIDWSAFTPTFLPDISKKGSKFGASDLGKGRRVMVEYSHPNPCKATHIGTARTTILGDSVASVLAFSGHNAIRANYYNDMGKQIAISVAAYEKWGVGKKPDKKPDHWLGDLYSQYVADAENNPALDERAQKIMYLFEISNDPEIAKLWHTVTSLAIQGFDQTYAKLGIKFDVIFKESDFKEIGRTMVKQAVEKGIAFKAPDGEIVADLEKHGLPNCVILRSDGTGVYYTSDLALTKGKFERHKLDHHIWVVAEQQKLYFQQLFKLFELLGFPWAKECTHLSYGMILLQGKKMSSRAGHFISFDDAVDGAFEAAKEECIKRDPELKSAKLDAIAQAIGNAALKYSILKVDPDKAVDFDLAKAVSFEGDTGPYLQYAAVRCKKILEKAGPYKATFDGGKLEPAEAAMIAKLAEFPGAVEHAALQLHPSTICNYGHSLAETFSTFYNECPVIGSDKQAFRLTLVKATLTVLENALGLLGITVPGQM